MSTLNQAVCPRCGKLALLCPPFSFCPPCSDRERARRKLQREGTALFRHAEAAVTGRPTGPT